MGIIDVADLPEFFNTSRNQVSSLIADMVHKEGHLIDKLKGHNE